MPGNQGPGLCCHGRNGDGKTKPKPPHAVPGTKPPHAKPGIKPPFARALHHCAHTSMGTLSHQSTTAKSSTLTLRLKRSTTAHPQSSAPTPPRLARAMGRSLRHPMERPTAPRLRRCTRVGYVVYFSIRRRQCVGGGGTLSREPRPRAISRLTGTGRCWTRMRCARSQV